MFKAYMRNSNEELRSFLELLQNYLYSEDSENIEKQLINLSNAELTHLFDIAKNNFNLQIDIWKILPKEIVEDPENSNVFENVLDNNFGEYLRGIDKGALVNLLNGSRQRTGVTNTSGQIIYFNISLLEQMKSDLLKDEIITDIFSFEQMLEILSNEQSARQFDYIVSSINNFNILKDIANDTENWDAKLQYLINLDDADRRRIINDYGFDGSFLVEIEKVRRENLFEWMRIGYYEDEEQGVVDCEIDSYLLLQATFGITYDEAKELIKKYGEDVEKIEVQDEESKKALRKLQIIKELVNFQNIEDLEEYYHSHEEEFMELSREVSPFYKVDLEISFVNLYSRQYDKILRAETTKLGEISYNGKSVEVYEITGDFNLLIRGEQEVYPENNNNFWNATQIGIRGLCQSTIGQDYIRMVNYERDDICYIASTSCGEGELRMAATTNIKSQGANVALSNIGINSEFGNGVIFRTPQEQINNSRGINNETITSRNIYNKETGICERKVPDYIVYVQETNDVDINKDPRFVTAQFAASQIGKPILIIPREKCAQRETEKISELKEKLLGNIERSQDETDESIIREMITKFNNNREGILTSKTLSEKYFTEGDHLELVGVINARLSQLKISNPEQYELLARTVSDIYKSEIEKYYAFSYDRDDAKDELDINATREHLKPYEDFLLAQERNMFELSNDEKNNIYNVMRRVSQTPYYDMNQFHSLDHIRKVVMFSGILAKNEGLNKEETTILLAAAAFHDSGREGAEGELDSHAVASARQVREFFENNPDNEFGITSENISIIQAAIEYHEHKEPEKGHIDAVKIGQLAFKYDINPEKCGTLIKVSELLKDADALDRARFGKKNENKWSLDSRYLKSNTAKSISLLRFSEECNAEFSERCEQEQDEKTEVLSENTVEEIFESELEEFNRSKIQRSSLRHCIKEITANQKSKFMSVIRNIRNMTKKIFNEFDR